MARGTLEPMYGDLEKKSVANLFSSIGDSLQEFGYSMTAVGISEQKALDNADMNSVDSWANAQAFGDGTTTNGYFGEITSTNDTSQYNNLLQQKNSELYTVENISEGARVSERVARKWLKERYGEFNTRSQRRMDWAVDMKNEMKVKTAYLSSMEKEYKQAQTVDSFIKKSKDIYNNTGMKLHDPYDTQSMDDPVFYIANVGGFAISQLSREIDGMYERGESVDIDSFLETKAKPYVEKAFASAPMKNGYTEQEIERKKEETMDIIEQSLRNHDNEKDIELKAQAEKSDMLVKNIILESTLNGNKLTPEQTQELYLSNGAGENKYLKTKMYNQMLTAQNSQYSAQQIQLSNYVLTNPEATTVDIYKFAESIGILENESGELYVNTIIRKTENDLEATHKEEYEKAKENVRLFMVENPTATGEQIEEYAQKIGYNQTTKHVREVKEWARRRDDDIALSQIVPENNDIPDYEKEMKKGYDSLLLYLQSNPNASKEDILSTVDKYLASNNLEMTDKWQVRLNDKINDHLEAQQNEEQRKIDTKKTEVYSAQALAGALAESNQVYIARAIYNQSRQLGNKKNTYYFSEGSEQNTASAFVTKEEILRNDEFNVSTEYGNIVESLLPNGTPLEKALLASEINTIAYTIQPKGQKTDLLNYAILDVEKYSKDDCMRMLQDTTSDLTPDEIESYRKKIEKRSSFALDNIKQFKTALKDVINLNILDENQKKWLLSLVDHNAMSDDEIFDYITSNHKKGIQIDELAKNVVNKTLSANATKDVSKIWKAWQKGEIDINSAQYDNVSQLVQDYESGLLDMIVDRSVVNDVANTMANNGYSSLSSLRDTIARKQYAGVDGYNGLTDDGKRAIDLAISLGMFSGKMYSMASSVPNQLGRNSDMVYIANPYGDSEFEFERPRYGAVDDKGYLYSTDGTDIVNIYRPEQYSIVERDGKDIVVFNGYQEPYKYNNYIVTPQKNFALGTGRVLQNPNTNRVFKKKNVAKNDKDLMNFFEKGESSARF